MTEPTVADVDAIGAVGDPITRNLRITQCYHELSAAIAERVSPGANWCTFATWASRQAGQTIRGEDIDRAAEDILASREIAEFVTGVVRVAAAHVDAAAHVVLPDEIRRILDPRRALRRAADAVAIGNRKVFVEIGREFARWRATAAAAGPPDAVATAAFCDALKPGEPPDGQRLLREAFATYGEACRSPNGNERASLLLLANLLVGLHEQTRLQPEIQASLDASIDADAVRAELLALVFPGFWLRLRARIARLTGRPMPADVAIDLLIAAVRRRIRHVITEMLMTLRVPGATLRLADDVSGEFPPELRQVTDPRLVALLGKVDPTPNATTGSGATDWADFAERMHFIADLFRCWHARADLFTPPFDGGQLAALRVGKVPQLD